MEHMLHFDGMLHWCFMISIVLYVIGVSWIVLRVLLPLRRLAQLARSVSDHTLPSFDQPIGGIPEIEQLRRALLDMTARIEAGQAREFAYRNALADSQEQERIRIAREIHDDTVQSLVLVAHTLDRASQMASSITTSANDLTAHLKTARSQLIGVMDSLRQMIAQLRPTVLDELGLISAIEMLCEEHPTLDFHVEGDVHPLDAAKELAIFRTAQEAIRNAERHAAAQRIVAHLAYTPNAVTFEVVDDGVGFEVPSQFQEFATLGHYGLIGIRERIVHIGGQLSLTSSQPTGTRLAVTIPALDLSTKT